MKTLRELIGLFVDGGSLAGGILALIACTEQVLLLLALPPVTNAFIFFAACLAPLLENVVRWAWRP